VFRLVFLVAFLLRCHDIFYAAARRRRRVADVRIVELGTVTSHAQRHKAARSRRRKTLGRHRAAFWVVTVLVLTIGSGLAMRAAGPGNELWHPTHVHRVDSLVYDGISRRGAVYPGSKASNGYRSGLTLTDMTTGDPEGVTRSQEFVDKLNVQIGHCYANVLTAPVDVPCVKGITAP
jgi:hypothetical protein